MLISIPYPNRKRFYKATLKSCTRNSKSCKNKKIKDFTTNLGQLGEPIAGKSKYGFMGGA